jgi:CheY-like chemotaxis protein
MMAADDAGGASSIDALMVRQALEHLYDSVELAGSPLIQHLPAIQAMADALQRAQALRRLLLDAIESLRPLRPTPPHVLAGRTYAVLSLRYVSGLAIEEVAEQLSVGERQVYRDLRRAEEQLVTILPLHTGGRQHEAGEEATLRAELAVLDTTPQLVDLADLLRGALDTVRSLAAQRHVHLAYDCPRRGVTATAPAGPTRQVFVQLLSGAVQCAQDQEMRVMLSEEGERVHVVVQVPAFRVPGQISLLQSACGMAQSIGLDCQFGAMAAGWYDVRLAFIRAPVRLVLIVEDNPGACELYQRYLQGTSWQAVVARDSGTVERAAADSHAAAVILDLLMPAVDGWSLLQRLRIDPRTAGIPVIVCSVISDPELADALGAAASLKKPVTRWELLETLQRVALMPDAA